MIDLFLTLLVLQALMGAFDTLFHHELKVALPQQISAQRELSIHAVRALLYGVIFAGLAWLEWRGLWVLVLSALILIEVGLTLWDFVVEDRTRVLPQTERIVHTLLAINGGAAFALLAVMFPDWYRSATELLPVDYGWRSWFLTCAAIGVAISGVRDALAAWQVQRLDIKLGLDIGCAHARFLISGGTGFIGSALCRELLHAGHSITLVTRDPIAAAVQFGGRVRCVEKAAELARDEHFDIVVNLAGAPVVGPRWSAARKAVLLNSRLTVTEDLLVFVQHARHRPEVWLQASAIGYYGTNSCASLDEAAPRGTGFAAELCQAWERKIQDLGRLSIRCVTLRCGLVFGRSGGSLPRLLLSHRLGLGIVLGTGKQHLGWIHLEDLLYLMAQAIRDSSWQGVYNAVAPEMPTYHQFAKLCAHLLHRPLIMRIPDAVLRRFLGEMASLFVDGPPILPKRLLDSRFEYRFPSLRTALMDLV